MTLIMLLTGLAVLILGAELLVRGASRFGAAIGISPLVVGLTIVSFGTSSPEMAVSLQAALKNHPDLIIGTIVGSTLFNILLTLGLCAVIAPLVVSQQLVWYEVPIMIASTLILFVLCLDGRIDRLDGLILFLGIVAYTVFAIYKGRKETTAISQEYELAFTTKIPEKLTLFIGKQLVLIITGLVFCVLGANWLLDSTVILARSLGISELVIGITLVAAGTSFPELATSVVAVIRGQRDIAIGNVVGSNIFNIFGIVGVAGLVAPEGIEIAPSVTRFDLPVAIAACVACLPIFFTGHKISRWEGLMFVGYYIAYISFLVMEASAHASLPTFSLIMMGFVVPLTLVTNIIFFYRALR